MAMKNENKYSDFVLKLNSLSREHAETDDRYSHFSGCRDTRMMNC